MHSSTRARAATSASRPCGQSALPSVGAAAKTDKARRLAIGNAVAVIGADGTAALTYRPGTYQVRRRSLAATTAPGRPATPAAIDRTDNWDWALAALVEGTGCVGSRLTNDLDYLDPDLDSPLDDDHGSGVAILDRRPEEPDGESRADLRQSTPARSSSTLGVDPDHDLETGSTPRTLDDLRQLLRSAVADGRVDPSSAESIRRTLRCSAARARQLRDETGGLR